MKRHLIILILIVTGLYVLWMLGFDSVYYQFVNSTLRGLRVFLPQMITYGMERGGDYILQITMNMKYTAAQPLNILCLPVIIIIAWQIYLFFLVPVKRALVLFLINFSIFYGFQIAYIISSPFLNISSLATQFNMVLSANFSILALLLIMKDLWRLRNIDSNKPKMTDSG